MLRKRNLSKTEGVENDVLEGREAETPLDSASPERNIPQHRTGQGPNSRLRCRSVGVVQTWCSLQILGLSRIARVGLGLAGASLPFSGNLAAILCCCGPVS